MRTDAEQTLHDLRQQALAAVDEYLKEAHKQLRGFTDRPGWYGAARVVEDHVTRARQAFDALT